MAALDQRQKFFSYFILNALGDLLLQIGWYIFIIDFYVFIILKILTT